MSVPSDAPSDATDVPAVAPKDRIRKRRRLIPRFRLRTLFVAGVLMSLLLGWYGRHVYRVRQERAAAEALRQVGAGLTMPTFEYAGATFPADLYGWFPWFYREDHTSVTLDSADGATDADLKHASELPRLNTLRLTGKEFTDKGLRQAGEFRSLSGLYFEATSVTGDGLASFEGRERLIFLEFVATSASGRSANIFERVEAMPNLTTVRTWREPITVEGMQATAKLDRLDRMHAFDVPRIERGALDELAKAPRLEELRLHSLPRVSSGDEELAAVCRIESLRVLAMTCPQATDAGFARLADLPNLHEVQVIAPNVTEAGARTLAQIETLERVMLPASSTDATLESLRALPNLEWVYLPAGVSREAAQRFANDHPDCEVIRNVPGFPNERYSAEPAADIEQTGVASD